MKINMANDAFIKTIEEGYTFKGKTIDFGGAMLDKQTVTGSIIKLPLATLNRHGLIAGSTGSGKTKTMQLLAEKLSLAGTPVLVMDIKGDLSGISQASEGHAKIDERHQAIGIDWAAQKLPVEFLSISDQPGTKLRATISEFGPVLFSKILELNDTQSGVVSLIYKYCDDKDLPLLDLKDFKKVIQYITGDGKEEVEAEYGSVSTASTGTIIRKIIELEEQGAEKLFGERSFDVEDLLRKDDEGRGFINVLRLTDLQTKPKLFSTFMLCLLAEIYEKFPEEGDVEQPKLCLFIDEAHLIFNESSKALLDQLESIVKLIRSKGVGVYFVTQTPTDVPSSILAQLGLKIQHSLRAFTANDRKAIKLTAENYPETEFYKVDELLTELGIGEAIITALSEKGNPTPLAHIMLAAPSTRMDTITDQELHAIIDRSSLTSKYNEDIERESAYEILGGKIDQAKKLAEEQESQESETSNNTKSVASKPKKEKSMVEELSKNTMVRQVGRTVVREAMRGLLGVLSGRRR
jgi:uncharacterized protein